MSKSMLEYLAGLRRYGHTPEYIGDATIGRTVYAAGRFVSPERDAPAGSRAARTDNTFWIEVPEINPVSEYRVRDGWQVIGGIYFDLTDAREAARAHKAARIVAIDQVSIGGQQRFRVFEEYAK